MSFTEETGDWELEVGGMRFNLADGPVVLGRDPECDVPLEDERVSWQHLRVALSDGTPELKDLGSSNGTYVEGRRIATDPVSVTRDTILQLGSIRARLWRITAEPSQSRGRFRRLPLRRRRLRIGRAPDNEVVLDEPNVSWHHAEVRPGTPRTIVDLGSRNGVRVGNELLQGSAPFRPGVSAGIGPFSLRIDADELIVVDERGGLTLAAQQVAVSVDEQVILQPTSFTVAPGEFVALIGPSGSGKTTLLRCLAGVNQPSVGAVVIGGEPVVLRLTDVGYVPQSDVVHARLSVREALLYAARLRLPSDTRPEEHAAAVDDVLDELRLADHQHTEIGRLSGGQRKRVACGVELIGKPTMLLLDEPTSGLDPALERRLMSTFRRLGDSGRGIVVATHATSSLSLCDTVAVMAPGGYLLFAGSPRESLERFQVSAYDQIYDALDLTPPPGIPPQVAASSKTPTRPRLLSGRSFARNTATLTARYARTLSRDRRTIGVLLAQAPIIALLIAVLYPSHLLRLPDDAPTRSAQFVFLLVTAAVWLGLIDSCREIVRERSIILRELAVGIRLDAYILAKTTVLFLLAAVQCILLIAIAAVIQPLHTGVSGYLTLGGLLILTSWSAAALGLVVSTVARSVDQATSLIPLLLIPQLLFGAALVPFARMSAPIKAIADLMVSRWAFAGAGHAIDMSARLAQAPQLGRVSGYGSSFFAVNPGAIAIILLGFTAAMLLLAAVILARRKQDT